MAEPSGPPDPPESRPPEPPPGAGAPRPPINIGAGRGAPPPPGYMPYPYPPPRPRSSILGRIFTGLIVSVLLLSLLLNVYLGMFFVTATSGPSEKPYQSGDLRARIVILPVTGMIDDRAADFVHDAVRSMRNNPPKAVILRVDSGGGSVSASDRIWHDLTQLRQEKSIPIIASFGGLAASGGYYIAAGADYIFVEPTTITGSIGVIAQAFTVHELMEKIGVTPEVVVSSDAIKKDRLNPFRAWTDEDRQELRVLLDTAHARFVKVVGEGRSQHLNDEQVRKLATGEPYTGAQALTHKLVDEQGYLDAAIAKAIDLAQLKVKPTITIMSPHRGLVAALLGAEASAPPAANAPQPWPQMLSAEDIRRWLGELSVPRLEYRMTP